MSTPVQIGEIKPSPGDTAVTAEGPEEVWRTFYRERLFGSDPFKRSSYPEDHPIAHIRFRHDAAHQVFERVMRVLRDPGDIKLVIIIGPTGVGKSWVIEQLLRELVLASIAEMKRDPSFIPSAYCEVPKSHRRTGPSPFVFRELLRMTNEPAVEYTRREFRNEDDDNRFRLENMLRYRRLVALFLDEAHHFFDFLGTEAKKAQMEFMKSLGNRSGCRLVLAGGHGILKALRTNGQTIRRTKVIPFLPYTRAKNDLEQFIGLLKRFERGLGSHLGVNLVDSEALIYERSLGCFGLLRELLSNAYQIARSRGRAVTITDIKESSRSIHELLQIQNEASECRTYVAEDEADWDVLRAALSSPEKEPEEPSQSSDSLHGRRPGKQRPNRKPTGTNVRLCGMS